jgi:hypothetical protein
MSSAVYGPPTPADLMGATNDINYMSATDAYYAGLADSAVVPDTSTIDLPGQLPGIPGGYASNGAIVAADPSGINALHTDPAVNPVPTGGYMPVAQAVLLAAAQGFSTFAKGSPSVAIPGARYPNNVVKGGNFLTTPTGATNWMTIGIIVVAGIVGLVVLAKYV